MAVVGSLVSYVTTEDAEMVFIIMYLLAVMASGRFSSMLTIRVVPEAQIN